MGLVKLNDRGVRSATTIGSVSGGSFTFIKKLTASASATLSFVDGASDVVLDDTYKEYMFTFKDIHPATDNVQFTFNMSIDTGSNYNVSKVHTFADAYNSEASADGVLNYSTDHDMVGTGVAKLTFNVGSDNDQSVSGHFTLFNPSSTTFVKHYIATTSLYAAWDASRRAAVAGYGNTTSAVDAIQFSMSSGNIDAGDICLYGIK